MKSSEFAHGSPVWYLVRSYIVVRLAFVFVLVPALSCLWAKKSQSPDNGSWLTLLESFDALHFKHVAEYGYTHEKNHAFFPGFAIVIAALSNVAS